jgi:addiction module HigA family antidote
LIWIWKIIMALKMHSSLAVHAGDWLKTEVVEPSGINVAQLARHFGVSRQALSMLLNGHASLSADMAIRFEKAFGVRADTLLRMQTAYDLAQARSHEGEISVARLELAA